MSTATAFPLAWPPHFPRTKHRERGQFKTTLPNAIKNVQDSLRRFASDSGKKLEGVVISSNCTLGVAAPQDPGVAVWFVWDGLQVCIPVDRYNRLEGNLQAIHHILEARRVELRHGTLALVRASFTGMLALPSPSATADWRVVLGVEPGASHADALKAYRKARSVAHREGSADAVMAVDAAWDACLNDPTQDKSGAEA